jgi:hypothetical protein
MELTTPTEKLRQLDEITSSSKTRHPSLGMSRKSALLCGKAAVTSEESGKSCFQEDVMGK